MRRTTPMLMPIRVEGDCLLAGDGPLIALSETRFAGPFGQLEFQTDEHGTVTHILVLVVEGALEARKIPSSP